MGYSKWNFHLGTLTCWPLARCIDYKLTIDRPSKVIRIPESEKLLIVESGIPETFSFGIRNPIQGIWNLANDCNPKSKFCWRGIRSPVSEIENIRLFWRRNWPALCFCLITVNSLLSSPSQISPLSLVTPTPLLRERKLISPPPLP